MSNRWNINKFYWLQKLGIIGYKDYNKFIVFTTIASCNGQKCENVLNFLDCIVDDDDDDDVSADNLYLEKAEEIELESKTHQWASA